MKNHFFHLVPLFFFTVMETVAAGLMVGIGWMLLAGVYLPGMHRYLLLTVLLAAGGIVISLFHLGKKERLLRALLGVRHSWLSREVIFAGLFVVSAGGVTIFVNTGHGQGAFVIDLAAVAAIISAVLLTWTIGMVYNLPGRFTWEGLRYSAAPLATALLLGTYWIIFLNAKPGPQFELVFFMMWLLDFLMALSRAITFRWLLDNRYKFEFPHLIILTRAGHMARLVFSFSLMTAALFLMKRTVFSMIIGNIILDRFCFYAGTAGVSPPSEIAFQKAERMKEAVM